MKDKTKKRIKRIVAGITITGGAMYAVNKIIDEAAKAKELSVEENETYYGWRNGRIHYIKKGNGSPLLLIHDLDPISSCYEWSKVIDDLSERYAIYAIDLPGCGKSEKPMQTYVNYLYVQLINDFIQDVIQEKTELVVTGASFSFAVMTARMNPEKITGIHAINPSTIDENLKAPDTCSVLAKRMFEVPILGTFVYNMMTSERQICNKFSDKYFADVTKVPFDLPDKYYETAHLDGSKGKYLYASIIGRYTNINIIHTIKKVECPIHIISTDRACLDQYLKYNDTIKTDYISDAGYLPQLEKPDKVISLICTE